MANNRKTRGSFHNFYNSSSRSPGSFDNLRGSFQQKRESFENIRESLQQRGYASFQNMKGSLTPNPRRKKRLSFQNKGKLSSMLLRKNNLDKSMKNGIVLPLVDE